MGKLSSVKLTVLNEIKSRGWNLFYWLMVCYCFALIMQNPYLVKNSATAFYIPYLIAAVLGEITAIFVLPNIVVLVLKLLLFIVKKSVKLLRNKNNFATTEAVKQKKLPKWVGACCLRQVLPS